LSNMRIMLCLALASLLLASSGLAQNFSGPSATRGDVKKRDFSKSKGSDFFAMNIARELKNTSGLAQDTLRFAAGFSKDNFPSITVLRLKQKALNASDSRKDENPSLNDDLGVAFRVVFQRVLIYTESGANAGFQRGEDTVDKIIPLRASSSGGGGLGGGSGVGGNLAQYVRAYSPVTFVQSSATQETGSFCRTDKLFCLDVIFNNGSSIDSAKFALRFNISAVTALGISTTNSQRLAVAVQVRWASKRSGTGDDDNDADVKDNSGSNTDTFKRNPTSTLKNDFQFSNGDGQRAFFNFERSCNFTKGSNSGNITVIGTKPLAEDSEFKGDDGGMKAKVVIFSFDKPIGDIATLYWDPSVGADESSAFGRLVFGLFSLFASLLVVMLLV
jgi:hypothetical protein